MSRVFCTLVLVHVVCEQRMLRRDLPVEPPLCTYAICHNVCANYSVEPPLYTYTISHTVCANSELLGLASAVYLCDMP